MALRGYPAFGPFFGVRGKDITDATPQITSPIHHVLTSVTLTTLTPPVAKLGFLGPLFLIADSVFSWSPAGNIATTNATLVTLAHAYQFIYDEVTAKWYAVGTDK
jgi:hypothetical protein